MNILTILGRPRKRGNTAAVLRVFEAAAGDRGVLTGQSEKGEELC